jgi:hypothetical protein
MLNCDGIWEKFFESWQNGKRVELRKDIFSLTMFTC